MRTGLEEPRRKLVTMWTKLVAKCFHYLYVAMVKITKANNVRWAERFLDPQLQWVHCCLAPCAGTKRRGWRNVVITNRKGPEIIYPARAAPPPRDFFQPDTNPYNLHNFLQRAPPAGNWLYDTQDCGGPYKIQSFIEKMERGFRGRDPFTRLSGCEGLGEGRGSDAWDHLV